VESFSINLTDTISIGMQRSNQFSTTYYNNNTSFCIYVDPGSKQGPEQLKISHTSQLVICKHHQVLNQTAWY
jgi:hypothetical protein